MDKILQIMPARPGYKITFSYAPDDRLPEPEDLTFRTIEAWALSEKNEPRQNPQYLILPLVLMPGSVQLTIASSLAEKFPCEIWDITRPEDDFEHPINSD